VCLSRKQGKPSSLIEVRPRREVNAILDPERRLYQLQEVWRWCGMPEMLPKPKYDIFSSEGPGFRSGPIRARQFPEEVGTSQRTSCLCNDTAVSMPTVTTDSTPETGVTVKGSRAFAESCTLRANTCKPFRNFDPSAAGMSRNRK
jgi:hypothetical protein